MGVTRKFVKVTSESNYACKWAWGHAPAQDPISLSVRIYESDRIYVSQPLQISTFFLKTCRTIPQSIGLQWTAMSSEVFTGEFQRFHRLDWLKTVRFHYGKNGNCDFGKPINMDGLITHTRRLSIFFAISLSIQQQFHEFNRKHCFWQMEHDISSYLHYLSYSVKCKNFGDLGHNESFFKRPSVPLKFWMVRVLCRNFEFWEKHFPFLPFQRW